VVIIETAKLGDSEKEFAGEEQASILGLDGSMGIHPSGVVRYELTALMAGPSLLVRGRVTCVISFECARCAETFACKVEETGFERVFEIPAGNESVDLTGDISESIILRFPTVPVCSSGCKGLCPRCGANLNREKCGCDRSVPRPGWEALDGLKLE